MQALKQFEKQQYLNLETLRHNGQTVKTPVWFAQDGETLHVWTFAAAGKIKRIRNHGNVRIAPSTVSGEPTGPWMNATENLKAQ
jgi:PPOX class probable F420-dependent enzyme